MVRPCAYATVRRGGPSVHDNHHPTPKSQHHSGRKPITLRGLRSLVRQYRPRYSNRGVTHMRIWSIWAQNRVFISPAEYLAARERRMSAHENPNPARECGAGPTAGVVGSDTHERCPYRGGPQSATTRAS